MAQLNEVRLHPLYVLAGRRATTAQNSGSGNSGKGSAQKTADKQSDKKTQDAKGHGLKNPAKTIVLPQVTSKDMWKQMRKR